MQKQVKTSPPPPFIQVMLTPEFYDHPVKNCQLIETHISWVILTGDYVYKIKKPVNLGFVDFTTLDKRKFYCEEELRLNRRLAPKLYLAVVAISGTMTHPELNASGKIFEYAVKMRQFSQKMQLDHVLARNELRVDMIDALAVLIADFHQHVDIARNNTDYGKPEQVYLPAKDNFIQLQEYIEDKPLRKILHILEQWTEDNFSKLENIFTRRKQNGFIRECHGDLHLKNLAWHKNLPLAFDCLEFNANFRWIDVMSEIAFLVMDLQDYKQPELAQRFLNHYLELTGDYEGCSVLQFYLVYRAMVRAKVSAIRAYQKGISKNESDNANRELTSYFQLALSYTKQEKPFVLITRGMSASGKSTLTQPLLEKLGAIRIRSDVERKRLFNIKATQNSKAKTEQGIYNKATTQKTYHKLLELTEFLINAGKPVIVDATFSNVDQRRLFREFAIQRKLTFKILEFTASADTLRKRISQRKQDVSDADIMVLENQIQNWRPLEDEEKIYSILINTEEPFDINQLISLIKPG